MEGLADDSQGRFRNNWKATMLKLRAQRSGLTPAGAGNYAAPLLDDEPVDGGSAGAYVQMNNSVSYCS